MYGTYSYLTNEPTINPIKTPTFRNSGNSELRRPRMLQNGNIFPNKNKILFFSLNHPWIMHYLLFEISEMKRTVPVW